MKPTHHLPFSPSYALRFALCACLSSSLMLGCGSTDEKPDEKPTQKNTENAKKEKSGQELLEDALVLLGDDGNGDPKAVKAALKSALEKDPSLAVAYYNLGVLFEKEGETGEAEFQYRQALAADPAMDLAAENLGVLLETGKQQVEARALYEKAIEDNSEAVGPRLRLARILYAEGDKKRSSTLAREALQYDAKSIEAYQLLALIYAEADRNQLARLIALRGQKLSPEDPQLLYALAIVAKNEKDIAQARALLKQLLEKDPEFIKARVDLSQMALKVRDWRTAQKQLEFLSEARPAADVFNALGVAKKGRGDFEGARAAYVKALELDGKFAPARYNLGILDLNHLNNPDEAQTAFSLYLEDGGEQSDQARTLLANAKTLIEARILEKKMLEEMKRQEEEAARLAAEAEAQAKVEAEAKARADAEAAAEAQARADAEAKAKAETPGGEASAGDAKPGDDKAGDTKPGDDKVAEEKADAPVEKAQEEKPPEVEEKKKKKRPKPRKRRRKKAKKKEPKPNKPEVDDNFFE